MNRPLREVAERLIKLADAGIELLPENELAAIAYGERAGKENEARKRVVQRMARAKVEAGFSRDAVFFDEVWPVALKALKASPR